MENNGKLFLIGRRRFGKTSLLAVAEEWADREHGPIVIRQDAERYLGSAELGQAILTEATRRMTGSVDRAAKALQRFAGSLKPEITVDPRAGTFSVAIGTTRPGQSEVPTLSDVLDVVDRLGAEAKRPVTVMIDEFQHVVTRDGEAAERQLRATIQRHHHVGYLFAGSAVRLLADMVGQQARPCYRLGQTMVLGRLPRGEFAAFIEQGFRAQGWHVDSAAIDLLLTSAEEVPYSVQRVAHEAWEMLRVAPAGASLTVEVMSAALQRVVDQEGPIYAQLWNGLTRRQQRTMAAIVAEKGEKLLSRATAVRIGLSTATIQTVLKALTSPERGLVIEEDGKEGKRYRLEDPLFAAWIGMTGRD